MTVTRVSHFTFARVSLASMNVHFFRDEQRESAVTAAQSLVHDALNQQQWKDISLPSLSSTRLAATDSVDGLEDFVHATLPLPDDGRKQDTTSASSPGQPRTRASLRHSPPDAYQSASAQEPSSSSSLASHSYPHSRSHPDAGSWFNETNDDVLRDLNTTELHDDPSVLPQSMPSRNASRDSFLDRLENINESIPHPGNDSFSYDTPASIPGNQAAAAMYANYDQSLSQDIGGSQDSLYADEGQRSLPPGEVTGNVSCTLWHV